MPWLPWYDALEAEVSAEAEETTMELSPDLIKGTIVPVLLRLLEEREMYGYEMIQVVNERTGNALAWKEATLYPWLHRLEGGGLLRGRWAEAESGRQRKYYRITPRGRAALRDQVAGWRSFSQAVNALLLAQPV